MKYYSLNNSEITEEQYNALKDSGKSFEAFNPIVDQAAENARPNSGRVQGLRQLSEVDQSTKDANEAQWIVDNPWASQLPDAKVRKVTKLSKKVCHRFEKYVDKHYAKATRRGSDTTPQVVKDYASELDTVWDTIKEEVNALTTLDEVNNYRINPVVWPDNSTVKNL